MQIRLCVGQWIAFHYNAARKLVWNFIVRELWLSVNASLSISVHNLWRPTIIVEDDRLLSGLGYYLGLCGGCSFLGCSLSSPFSRGEGAPLWGEVGSSLASSTTSSWPISFSSFFSFLWSGSAGLRVLYFSLSPGEMEFLCNKNLHSSIITPQTNLIWQYWKLLVQIRSM